tara:strand:- start:128 stop:493 length:366 start_codon:yes stop_codon:yes gene_type:complete
MATTAGSAGVAAVTTTVLPSLGAAGVAGSAVVGGLAGAALVGESKSLSAETIKEVENPWQMALVAFDQLLAHAWEIVLALGIAIIGIPMLITYLLGRFKQRPEDAKAINSLVEKVAKMKEK